MSIRNGQNKTNPNRKLNENERKSKTEETSLVLLGMLDVTRVLKERSKEMALEHHVEMAIALLVHIQNDLTTLLVQSQVVLCPTGKHLRETFL